jgi:hypothetical protein
MAEIGVPTWTTGHFSRVNALDDLGLESVGAGMLRRLLPGIVQTTPNAGYYSFYPYLLAKWEDAHESTERVAFKPFYRRQEAAYAVACLLHKHRGDLAGIQGSIHAGDEIATSSTTIDLGRLSESYMQSPYGGYGLFYARVLSDLRLTQIGKQRYVDRVTDRGREVADAFAKTFEATSYFESFFGADEVPLKVLTELGSTTCLCTIPGRSDHRALLDAFIGEPTEDPAWESRRRTRVESLSLFLEYHRGRPDAVTAAIDDFRRTLLTCAFSDGTEFTTPSPERQQSWRAYQLRECETYALTTIWSRYLQWLEHLGPSTHNALRSDLLAGVEWSAAGLRPDTRLSEATAIARTTFSDAASIVTTVSRLGRDPDDDVRRSLARALLVLLEIAELAGDEQSGFIELRDEGGSDRWSLERLRRWFEVRQDDTVDAALADLVDDLYLLHMGVGTRKLSPTDHRDPFCVAEDDGVLRLLRSDEPFWTGARFDVVNHLLWTLGLLESPEGDARPTELGISTLAEIAKGA